MRVGLILISAALLLTGCSTVRGIFGGGNNAAEASQTSGETGASDSGRKARAAISPSEDIKKAAKRLPDNLAGDSANAAHLGEPIPPQ